MPPTHRISAGAGTRPRASTKDAATRSSCAGWPACGGTPSGRVIFGAAASTAQATAYMTAIQTNWRH